MALPQSDVEYLNQKGLQYTVAEEAGMTCVAFQDYKLPPGFNQEAADLLIRLSKGFPDIPPDMWWFEPAVHRKDGKLIQATDQVEHYLGRSWQRWSRHIQGGQWQPGSDTLETFLAVIGRELERTGSME